MLLEEKALDDQLTLVQALFYYAIPSQVFILLSMSYMLPLITEILIQYPHVTEENQDASAKINQLRTELLNRSEQVEDI